MKNNSWRSYVKIRKTARGKICSKKKEKGENGDCMTDSVIGLCAEIK
jgi:hypothetical protein